MNSLEMAQSVKTLREQYEAQGRALFDGFMEKLFKDFPHLNIVILRGWTPGFNDGDPCEHSQETMVGADSFGENCFKSGEDEDEPSEDVWVNYVQGNQRYRQPDYVPGHYEPTQFFPNKALAPEAAKDIEAALSEFEPTLKTLHGTDWELTWRRDGPDGAVKFEKDHYDCGH